MRLLSFFSLFVFLMLSSFPITADAFSRRSSHSEIAQTVPLRTTQTNASQTNTLNASPQAIPEPSVLLLMSIGFGMLAVGVIVKRFRRPNSSPE